MFCGAEPLTAVRQETAKPTEGSPSPTSRSADHIQGFTWISSRTHTNMDSTSHRASFLTRVAGNFRTARDVLIYSSNGSWWLGGSELVVAGSPNTVSARARCSAVYSFTGEYTWSQGQDATPMGSIYGRSCFLTRVGGQLPATANGSMCLQAPRRRGGSAAARCISGCTPGRGASSMGRHPFLNSHTPIRVGSTPARRGGSTAHIVGVLPRWSCGGFSSSNTLVTIFPQDGFWKMSGRPVKRRTVQRWGDEVDSQRRHIIRIKRHPCSIRPDYFVRADLTLGFR